MAFIDPQKNIEQFGLEKGMMVADLGVGSGFYTISASKKVGEDGRVYAIDVQKNLLEKLQKQAETERIFNIEYIWGDVEKLGGTRLADSSVDAIILSNILFQIENKELLASEIKRILRPNGRVLVVDWSDSFNNMGPTKEMVFNEQQAEDFFINKGFVVVKKIEAGENHYGIIFRMKEK